MRLNSPPTVETGFGKFSKKWQFAIDDLNRLPKIRLLVTDTRLLVTLIFDNLVETSCKIRLRIDHFGGWSFKQKV